MVIKIRENKALWEIGKLIHVRYKGFMRRIELTIEEFIDSYEYKQFKKKYPLISRLAEEYKE